MGSLDHSLNTTKKLANERDRGEKTLLVFVITTVIKKRRRGDADLPLIFKSTFGFRNV